MCKYFYQYYNISLDLNCQALFDSSCSKFQELNPGMVIDNAREINGLFVYED